MWPLVPVTLPPGCEYMQTARLMASRLQQRGVSSALVLSAADDLRARVAFAVEPFDAKGAVAPVSQRTDDGSHSSQPLSSHSEGLWGDLGLNADAASSGGTAAKSSVSSRFAQMSDSAWDSFERNEQRPPTSW